MPCVIYGVKKKKLWPTLGTREMFAGYWWGKPHEKRQFGKLRCRWDEYEDGS
jgi:hypothetical protein